MVLLFGCFNVVEGSTITTFATHLMVWQDRNQGWYSPTNTSGYRIQSPGGELRSIDWLNETLSTYHLEQVKSAGISAVIVDLTNSFGEFLPHIPVLQRICSKLGGLQLAAQVAGSVSDVERQAGVVWNALVAPTPNNTKTYWRVHSKPVLVVYVERETYDAIQNAGTKLPNLAQFDVRWSSGEDSNPGKWGWQVEPWVGFEPSADSMFITPSTGHDPLKVGSKWRKSLAWLDYGMLLALKYKPRVVIVGSYDDVMERNAWLVADTSEGTPPERQMRDMTGAISSDAFYNRVKQWIRGTPRTMMRTGAVLPDGAYHIGPSNDVGDHVILNSSQSLFLPETGAALISTAATGARRDVLHWYTSCNVCGRQVCSPGCQPHCCMAVANATQRFFVGATRAQLGCDTMAVRKDAALVCDDGKIFGVQNGTAPLFWLSHAGNNSYHIFALNTGLVLTAQGGTVTQQWPTANSASQLWRLEGVTADSLTVVSSNIDTELEWRMNQEGSVALEPAPGTRWAFRATPAARTASELHLHS